jgi:hypothetical protein
LKLKTLLRFYQNRSNLIFFVSILTILSGHAYGEDKSGSKSEKGIFTTLKKTIEAHRGLLKRQFNSYKQLSTTEVNGIKEFELNRSYVRSLILHSPQRFFKLIDNKDQCQVYDLILNNLLRGEPETSKYVVITNQEQNNFLVEKEDFKQILFKKKCPRHFQKFQFFKPNTLGSFINTVSFRTPTTQSECHQVYDEWLKNQYVPNFCSLTQIDEERKQLLLQRSQLSTTDIEGLRKVNNLIEQNSRKKRAIPVGATTYLNNLCQNLDSQNGFCKLYVSPHVWHKVLAGERPDYLMTYRCKDLGSKVKLSSCRQRLLGEPEKCLFAGVKNFPALAPKPNCNLQSFLLNQTRLVTPYRDCPGFVNNSSIINVNRIYTHFYPENGIEPSTSCQNVSVNNFAKLNEDYNNKTAWPMKICYFDKIENDKVCKSYVPREGDEVNSETRIVADIIKRTRPSPNNLTCKKIGSTNFRPSRLKYKVGCFIVSDFLNCTLDQCPRKIYHEGQEVTGIEYEGSPDIHYFDDGLINPRYTQLKLLQREYKIRKKNLSNFTILRTFLNQRKKNIVHGIGCLELLMPRMFRSRGFNQCTPEAFIIDDILELEGKKFVIARLGIDDVHSPRLIWWHNIFHAVRKYQELHPAKPWTLYGAYLEQ